MENMETTTDTLQAETLDEDTIIDQSWDDDNWEENQTSQDTTEVEVPTTAPDHQQEEQGEEVAEDTQDAPPQETTTDIQAPTASDTLMLRYNHQNREVSREEAIALAQKGLNYDSVLGERDSLRSYQDQAKPIMETIEKWAQRSNMTVEQYMGAIRQKELMSRGMDESMAKATMDLEDREAAIRTIEATQQAAKETATSAQKADEARKQNIADFVREYPGIAKEDIPKEVWLAVAKGERMSEAYRRTTEAKRTKKMESELADLRAKLATVTQNQANRQRAPGSMASGGTKTEQDIIDEIWSQ